MSSHIRYMILGAACFGLGVLLSAGLRCDRIAPAPQLQPSAATVHEDHGYTVSAPKSSFTSHDKGAALEVKAWRIMTPFGLSPGQVIEGVKALEEKGGQTPAATVNDQGVQTTAADQSSQKTFGMSWTWWDKLKAWFHKLMWFGILGGVGLLAMYFIPATRPIASMILRGLAAVVPIIGSVVERVVAMFKWQKPLEQTVAGVQNLKVGLTEDEKKAMNATLMAAQDTSTQATVRAIKADLP